MLSSEETTPWTLDRSLFKDEAHYAQVMEGLGLKEPAQYQKRWVFEPLQLVPALSQEAQAMLSFVLGSADPLSRQVGFSFADPDIFNLSFTPPKQLDALHREMAAFCQDRPRPWHRARLPRTVLVFIDPSPQVALERAHACFDTYIEAMRGTVGFPSKEVLLSRALVGDPAMICEQLQDQEHYGFDHDDRLMLWFEFNQANHDAVAQQMRLFAEKVAAKFQ